MTEAKAMFGAPNGAFPLPDALNSVLIARQAPAVMRLGFPFVSTAGVEALVKAVHGCAHWAQGRKIWLVGIHQGITEPAALRRIGALPSSEVRVFSNTGDISQRTLRARPLFHAKIVGVEGEVPANQIAPLEALIVSSANLSAAEMVAAFASEYRLATLVGVKTPGRLVATSAFKIGLGYRVVLPVAAYFTWHGTNLEGSGLAPDIEEPLSPEAVWSGEDNQLKRAVDCLNETAPAV